MKKSRIIVPALAMLTLSVAASVTGTVAWFSASRTANLTAKSVSVMNAAGDLGVELIAGLNTGVNGSTVTNTPLMDASVNVDSLGADVADKANVDVYTANINSDNEITGLAAHKGDYSKDIKNGETSTTVYAVNTWKAKFSTSAVSSNYLFFDTRLSKSNLTALSETGANKSVYRALRVCMFVGAQKLVWAPYTEEEYVYHAINYGNMVHNVSVNSRFDSANYGDIVKKTTKAIKAPVDIIKSGDTLGKASSNDALLSSELTAATPITVSFVLWFEGLDSNCVSSAQEINSIGTAVTKTLNLSFYSVDSTTLTGEGA